MHEMSCCSARNKATSRACHVGVRSSCSESSCSSMTTIERRFGTLANTALRAPTTTSTPPAALAHSSGSTATESPCRFNADASNRARVIVGITTSVGPFIAAPITVPSGEIVGPLLTKALDPDCTHASTVSSAPCDSRARSYDLRLEGRVCTNVDGVALTNNERSRPCHRDRTSPNK